MHAQQDTAARTTACYPFFMADRDDERPAPRCPYCQSEALTRLEVSDSLPVDVYKCLGCGTQFNLARLRGDLPPENVSISGD
jgi:DNA-directed RNA polymerase subunit RPC12/RpoP